MKQRWMKFDKHRLRLDQIVGYSSLPPVLQLNTIGDRALEVSAHIIEALTLHLASGEKLLVQAPADVVLAWTERLDRVFGVPAAQVPDAQP